MTILFRFRIINATFELRRAGKFKTNKKNYFPFLMKPVWRYIQLYFYEVDKRVLFSVSALTALLIFWNYHFGADQAIETHHSFPFRFITRYSIFLFAFSL